MMTGVLISRGKKTQRQTQKEDDHVKTESETGVMLPRAKEHLGLLEAGRSKERSFSTDFGGSMALPTP